MCLTSDVSLDSFRLYQWWEWLVWKTFFSSRIDFLALNTVCVLENSQICIWARPLSSTPTSMSNRPLDISSWHVQTWTPFYFLQSLLHPQPLHISWCRLYPSGLSVPKPWSHSWLFSLLPSIQCVHRFSWLYLQNSSRKESLLPASSEPPTSLGLDYCLVVSTCIADSFIPCKFLLKCYLLMEDHPNNLI